MFAATFLGNNYSANIATISSENKIMLVLFCGRMRSQTNACIFVFFNVCKIPKHMKRKELNKKLVVLFLLVPG